VAPRERASQAEERPRSDEGSKRLYWRAEASGENTVEVKIGIQSVPRELVVETDTPADEIERLLSAVLEQGDHAVFALSVAKGGRVLVPADKIAYVELGGAEARRVGFGNIVLPAGLPPRLQSRCWYRG
jgi:hypothetical protein